MAELILLPIDADVAHALSDDATRLAAGSLLSGLLRAGQATDKRAVLLSAIGQLKIAVHRNGLTDALLDDELRHDAVGLRQGVLR